MRVTFTRHIFLGGRALLRQRCSARPINQSPNPSRNLPPALPVPLPLPLPLPMLHI